MNSRFLLFLKTLKTIETASLAFVYSPNINQGRVDLWKELDAVRARWNGPWCIGGDFYIRRFPEEKLGGCPISSEMWIISQGMLDCS